MTVIRQTQEIVHVLYDASVELYLTQHVVQVLYEADAQIFLTQEIIQVLYKPPPPPFRVQQLYLDTLHTGYVGNFRVQQLYTDVLFKIDPLSMKTMQAEITVIGAVNAQLTTPKLTANFQTTGLLAGNITGSWNIVSNITATGSLDALLTSFTLLTTDIAVTGDITTANIRKNIEYLTASITATGDITSAIMTVPWHGGNTLRLTQSVSVALVLTRSINHTLNFQQNAALVFGQRSLTASNTVLFTQDVDVVRVLPVETASNTLSLSHTLSEYREATSYLVLQHTAVGVISFIEGIASNVLNLTDSVSKAGTVFNLSASNQLDLTHSASWTQIQTELAANSLLLKQNAFAVTLQSKKYVLLQAPFELIQTSVILPNPLLDDNENLVSNFALRRSMDNTPRTYVKTSKNRRLRYTFTMNRLKALELEGFCKAYNGANIKVLNWKGEIWRVKLITNPIDFVQTRRHEPGGNRTDVNLEFEGVLLNG